MSEDKVWIEEVKLKPSEWNENCNLWDHRRSL